MEKIFWVTNNPGYVKAYWVLYLPSPPIVLVVGNIHSMRQKPPSNGESQGCWSSPAWNL